MTLRPWRNIRAMANETPSKPRPLYLFADSQLLFWKQGERRLLESIVQNPGGGSPRAAYLGAFAAVLADGTRQTADQPAVAEG